MTEVVSIVAAVAEAVGNLSERTRQQVVEHFAVEESAKQAKAIIAGLDKISSFEKDYKKIKPSYQGFDEEGNPVGASFYTKEQDEQRKKLREQIGKLDKAVSKADEKADFGDLYNLVK